MIRPQSDFLDEYPTYDEDLALDHLSGHHDSIGGPSDQWQALDPSNYVVTDNRMSASMNVAAPLSYDVTSIPTHIEPEIAAFLNDYFLDDTSWNLQEAGPSLTFHFGNL